LGADGSRVWPCGGEGKCGRVGVKGTEGSSEGESLAGFHCKANAGADSAGEARTFVFKSLALKITK